MLVNKNYTPNAAVMDDMGWTPIFCKQWKCLARLWCRLTNMSSNRLNRKVLKWANDMSIRHKCVKNWNYDIRKVFCSHQLSHFTNITDNVNAKLVINTLLSKMMDDYINTWKVNVQQTESKSKKGRNKLRTYNLFKLDFLTEAYCKMTLPYHFRSAFAKFRCGVAPLRVETGRYENVV